MSATTTFKRRHPLASLLRRLLARRPKDVPLQSSSFADAMSSLTPAQQRELAELMHRGLRTWEGAPNWLIQWHDAITGVPAPMERPVSAQALA